MDGWRWSSTTSQPGGRAVPEAAPFSFGDDASRERLMMPRRLPMALRLRPSPLADDALLALPLLLLTSGTDVMRSTSVRRPRPQWRRRGCVCGGGGDGASAVISPVGGRCAPWASAKLMRERAQMAAMASSASWISGSTARRIPSNEKSATGGSRTSGAVAGAARADVLPGPPPDDVARPRIAALLMKVSASVRARETSRERGPV